jgi:hypothetical protein
MEDLPFDPHHLALIIDGVVQDVMFTDPRLAAILLSTPTVVEITPSSDPTVPRPDVYIGTLYDSATGVFTSPEGSAQ